MLRDVTLFLEDMKIACEKVARYVKNMRQKQFIEDEKTYDAVVRNLTIIGEAVKNVPQEFRELHQNIEWRKIAGFRDVAVHDYFGIDEDILLGYYPEWNSLSAETIKSYNHQRKVKPLFDKMHRYSTIGCVPKPCPGC